MQSLAKSGLALNDGKRETEEFPATDSLWTGIERKAARVFKIAANLLGNTPACSPAGNLPL